MTDWNSFFLMGRLHQTLNQKYNPDCEKHHFIKLLNTLEIRIDTLQVIDMYIISCTQRSYLIHTKNQQCTSWRDELTLACRLTTLHYRQLSSRSHPNSATTNDRRRQTTRDARWRWMMGDGVVSVFQALEYLYEIMFHLTITI